jgi:hypothetical protein
VPLNIRIKSYREKEGQEDLRMPETGKWKGRKD